MMAIKRKSERLIGRSKLEKLGPIIGEDSLKILNNYVERYGHKGSYCIEYDNGSKAHVTLLEDGYALYDLMLKKNSAKTIKEKISDAWHEPAEMDAVTKEFID